MPSPVLAGMLLCDCLVIGTPIFHASLKIMTENLAHSKKNHRLGVHSCGGTLMSVGEAGPPQSDMFFLLGGGVGT